MANQDSNVKIYEHQIKKENDGTDSITVENNSQIRTGSAASVRSTGKSPLQQKAAEARNMTADAGMGKRNGPPDHTITDTVVQSKMDQDMGRVVEGFDVGS